MSVLNAVLARVIDFLLAPFSTLPPIAGLTVASLVTAAAMLLVFRRTSDQARLTTVKRSIHAALFEIGCSTMISARLRGRSGSRLRSSALPSE